MKEQIMIFLLLIIFFHKSTISCEGNITIIINEEGIQQIFSQKWFDITRIYPDRIILNNEELSDYKTSFINTTSSNNTIIIEWSEPFQTFENFFYSCYNISKVDLSNFNFSAITDTRYMFYNCISLVSVKLPNFSTSNLKYTDYMFDGCSSLVSLNLSAFNTSNVETMQFMFNNCSLLFSLDLSNFDTSKVTNMTNMFNNCPKLQYIYFSHSVDIINELNKNIFNYIQTNVTICLKIELYDRIENMNFPKNVSSYYHYKDNNDTFCFIENNECPKEYNKLIPEEKECVKMCSLDSIYKFEFDNQCYIQCPNGSYVLPSNNQCQKISGSILDVKIKDSISINLEPIYDKNPINITPTISDKQKQNKTNNLEKCINILQKFYNLSNNEIIIRYRDSIQRQGYTNVIKTLFEFYYISQNGNNIKLNSSICEEAYNCSEISIESLEFNACESCRKGFYPLYSANNKTFYKKCYQDPEGYFLNNNDQNYHECYQSCETCLTFGDKETHNCLKCKNNYKFPMIINNNYNCYEYCDDFFYIEEKKYYCKEKPACNASYFKYIEDKNRCIEECSKDPEYKYQYKKRCYKECPQGSQISQDKEYFCEIKCTEEYPYLDIENQICIKDCSVNDLFNKICKKNYIETINNKTEAKKENLGSKIIKGILNGTLDSILSQILQGSRNNNTNETNNIFMIQDDNDYHLISTVGGQLNKANHSSIDLGQCEKFLRNKSNIKDDEELIMYKIEHNIEGLNIPIIEYTIFTQDGKKQLDLSLCDKMNIEYQIPVSIDEDNVAKYNPESEFYNDECNKYKSENGTDMTLYDRKNEYNNNNMAVCEKGCTFKNYNTNTKKAECDCNVKSNIDSDFNNKANNPDELVDKIEGNEKQISNVQVTKCLNFSWKQIISNSGFYSLLIIIIAYFIVMIIFCIKGRDNLENTIDEVIYKKFNEEKIKEEIQEKEINKVNDKVNDKIVDSIHNEKIIKKKKVVRKHLKKVKTNDLIQPSNKNSNN